MTARKVFASGSPAGRPLHDDGRSYDDPRERTDGAALRDPVRPPPACEFTTTGARSACAAPARNDVMLDGVFVPDAAIELAPARRAAGYRCGTWSHHRPAPDLLRLRRRGRGRAGPRGAPGRAPPPRRRDAGAGRRDGERPGHRAHGAAPDDRRGQRRADGTRGHQPGPDRPRGGRRGRDPDRGGRDGGRRGAPASSGRSASSGCSATCRAPATTRCAAPPSGATPGAWPSASISMIDRSWAFRRRACGSGTVPSAAVPCH